MRQGSLTAYVLVDILPISLALPTGSVSTCIIFRSQQVHTGGVTLVYQPGQVSFPRWGLEPGEYVSCVLYYIYFGGLTLSIDCVSSFS
jgi:hypothetical protein